MKPEKVESFAYKITLVPHDRAAHVWMSVYKYLDKAVERSHGRWTMETLFNAVATGRQQLWIVLDENDNIDGVATTEIINYPNRKMLAIQYLGGEGLGFWANQILEVFNSWARDNKCKGIEATARKGFWKWLKHDGFDEAYTVFEKRIEP